MDPADQPHTGPLSGIRVLELSLALTGPYIGALFADQGADVVKVERPDIGDILRWIGPSVNGLSAVFRVCNRGKQSIAVDIRTDAGREIALELAAQADVVIQNFRPGVAERLGVGYENVVAVNPDVVYLSLTGFGEVGPYRDRSAYDTVIQAYGGLASSQAGSGGEPIFLPDGTPAGQVTSGAYGYSVDLSLALCYIKAGMARPGDTVCVAILGRPHEAKILERPPFDPEGLKLRA